jgi:peptide/nickel transport system substrate-binding protein
MQHLWRFLVACLLAVTAGPLAAEEPQRGGELIFGVNAVDPPTYDCHASALFTIIHLLTPHYSTLLKINPEKYPDVMGDLAESWTVAPDYKTYTFRLHPNIKFHDGSALTSADIKATYERIRNPPAGVVSVRQALLADVDSIETPDPQTVVFRTKSSAPSMIYTFALPWNCIYSAAKLAEDPRWPATHVMGTGPFKFVEHANGSSWTGARFDGYFKPGKPYLDGFKAVFLQGSALINAIQGGQIVGDFRSITPSDKDRLVQAMGDRIVIREEPWVSTLNVVFNTQHKPFDDPRVRRALSLAIDRWKASEVLSRQAILRSVGVLLRPGSKMAAREEDLVKLPGFSHDLAANRAEARRLLKEAGLERFSFKLTNRTITNLFVPAGVFMIDQWRQIGISVEHVQVNETAYNVAQSSGMFEAMLTGEGDAIDEPDYQLVRYLSSDVAPANRARYIDRTLDELYQQQRVSIDPAERYKLLRAFETRAMDQAYIVPLLWWHRIVALSPKVKGWYMAPSHLINQDLESVWLEK